MWHQRAMTHPKGIKPKAARARQRSGKHASTTMGDGVFRGSVQRSYLKNKRRYNSVHRLQNKVLRTIGNFPRCTSVRDMHTAFNLPYVYDYITKLCRKQAGVIRNHENEHVRGIGQGKARHRKYKRLKLGGVQAAVAA
jgi:hypothetical protein